MNPEGFWGLPNNWVLMPIAWIISIVFFHKGVAHTDTTWRQTLLFFLLLSVAGIIGAKLFSLYLRDWQLMPLIDELKGGWRHPGSLAAKALAVPLLAMWLFRHLSTWHVVDVFALSFCLLAALLRFGCFMNGCCFGDICNEWYCLTYPKGSAVWFHQYHAGHIYINATESKPAFPAHLLLGTLELITFGILCWLMKHRQFYGQVAKAFLVLQGACKALAESYKVPFSSELQNAAFISIGLGIILVIMTWHRGWNNIGIRLHNKNDSLG